MATLPIGDRDRLFVLTGAGVSAESGLPTFRGADGLWRGYRVEEVASPVAWQRSPQMVWEFYSWRRDVHRTVRPNPGHVALVRLEERLGERMFLCTQNVDSLHEQAGSKRVVHMHGRLLESRCDRCTRPPFEDTRSYASLDDVPRCPCGGMWRPNIVWFGETPMHLDEILAAIGRTTLFLAAGTSGAVYPAASLAQAARQAGARTFYIGPEEPLNRHAFDECFLGKSGEVLPGLLSVG
jgi:NAD-dependent deacetylase